MLFLKSLFIIYSVFGIGDSVDQNPDMYLCLDSMMQKFKVDGKPASKLVYGYIDGKKTGCMSEHELRAKFSESNYKEKKNAEIDSQKLLESSGKRKKTRSIGIKDAVFKGMKNLAGADFRGWDLNGVDLSGANLQNANFESADLRTANLSGANLQGASLEFAFLKNANLKGANLSNARLKGAYLKCANLKGVEGLTLEQIRMVATIHKTVFDPDMMELIREYCPGKMNDSGWQWRTTVFNSDSLIPENERVNSKQFH